MTEASARDLAVTAGQDVAEEAAGVAGLDLGDVLGRALGDDRAAAGAALGAHVDDPVGGLDHVEVVLDDEHRVARVDQPAEHAEQLADVLEVQAGGRLVEDVDGAAGRALLQLGGELDPLRLAAGQRRRRLAEPDVAEPDVDERAQVPGDRRDGREELGRLLDRHVEDLGDGLALEVHLERLAVVARAVADLARDVDVRQEVHLDLDRAVAGAGLAAAALDVEGEPARQVAADLGLGRLGEQPCGCGRRRRCRSPGWTAACGRSATGRRRRPCRRARGPSTRAVPAGHRAGAVELAGQHGVAGCR